MVSIIIPVYNAEAFLERCVKSCLDQTYSDIEVILIDDGSTDLSSKKCDMYEQQDKRVKAFHKKNGGVSSARNVGLDMARGSFVAFVDSDDWIQNDMIEQLLHVQENNDCDWIICGHNIFTDGNLEEERKFFTPFLKSVEEILKFILSPQNERPFRSPCGRLYRRDIIENNGLRFNTDLTLGEDTVFNYQYLSRITKVVAMKDYCGYNVNVISNNEKNKRYYRSADFLFKSRMIMFESFLDIFRRNGFYEEYQDQIAQKFIYSVSIMENIATYAGFSSKDIIRQNRIISVRNEFELAKYRGLSFRDKITLFCYRTKQYMFLYYLYAIYSKLH